MSDALDNLIGLFDGEGDRQIFSAWQDEQAVALNGLRKEVARLTGKLADRPEQRWLLYSTSPHNFTVGLLTLLTLGKDLLICAGNQPGWLFSIASRFDVVLTDTVTDAGKPVVDFNCHDNESSLPLLDLSGQESISFLTSGSTGEPKSINKPLLALTNEVSTLAATFPECSRDCVFAASVSHLHIYGLLFNILLPLLYKSRIVPCKVEYQEQLQPLSKHFSDLVFISSPAFLSRLDTNLPPHGLRSVFSSGGLLSFDSAQDALHCFSTMPVEVYGSTETGGIGYRQQREASTPWRAFEGVILKNINGETAIVSPNMPNEPPYVLDDKLRFFPDGSFQLMGRKDRIVKIEENRISLNEIEKFLVSTDDVQLCHAVVLQGKRTCIGCVVILTDSGRAMLAEKGRMNMIREWKQMLKTRFEPAAVPRKWHISDNIPANTQGKTDHQYLLSLFDKEGQ